VAGVVHALAILTFVVAAAPLAGYLAMPAMAALLIATAWSMSEPHRWREHFRARPSDRFLLLLTMVLTVVSDLAVAIAVGTAVGLAQRLMRRDVEPAQWTPPDR
jgi:SulP family sulfate permease